MASSTSGGAAAAGGVDFQPEDDFIVRRGRMTLKGFGRFDLAYFRHTERWSTVYRGLTAAECFEEIEGNEVFWPM